MDLHDGPHRGLVKLAESTRDKMLRNMKVGTKLLAVVLPPLLVLVAVAWFGARDRLAERDDAQTAQSYIELTEKGDDLVLALQSERTLSVLEAAAPGSVEGLDERRAATDEAARQFAAAADAAQGNDAVDQLTVPLVGRVSPDAEMSAIVTMRSSVERGSIDPKIVDTWYIDTISDELDVATAISNEIPFPEVTADLGSRVTEARAIEAVSQQNSTFTIAVGEGEFDPEGQLWRDYWDRGAAAERNYNLFFEIATPDQQAELRRVVSSPAYANVQDFTDPVMGAVSETVYVFEQGVLIGTEPLQLTPTFLERTAEAPAGETASVATWVSLTDTQLDALEVPGEDILASVTTVVSDALSEAEQAALVYLLLTVAAIIVSSLLALVVARRITRPLRNLTDAADRLSTQQLPALVERLKSPGSSSGEVILEPISMKREDEIGHLADAFDAIQRVTVEVAEEQQTLLKKGIGDIFVNLARRNQSLLDRQIEFIDQLESSEEDPDVLEDLFKLDHLATRMRRNAESLLVLAGVDTGNRRSRPVSLADVVRVAVGEVEDFARLNLVSLDDAIVTGAAAMDVAHLLSELMENATAFSPPETQVEVLGHMNSDGTYVLSISDQGIGMSDEQFTETNKLLAEPPLVGLTLSRSLGFTVVARLAARFDIQVRLTSSPTGGVTALVTLPSSALEQTTISVEPDAQPVETVEPVGFAPEPTPEVPAFAPEPTPEVPAFAPEPTPEVPAFATEPVAEAPAEPEIDEPEPHEWVPDAPAPSTLAGAVPEGAAFDAGLAALIGEDESTPTTFEEPVAPSASDDGVSLFGDASPEPSEPAPEPVRTSAGLVKRVPRAAAPAAEASDRPSEAGAPVARTQRSPEEVRAMLSRYRSGLHRGRDGEMSNGSSIDGAD